MNTRTQESSDLQPMGESFLQQLVENLSDGLIVINTQGIILLFNSAAECVFGYTQADVLGRNISQLMPEPYAHEHDGYLKNYLITGKKNIIARGREVIGKRKDGSTVPLYLSVSEMLIDGERLFSGIIQDLSVRKNTQQQIRKSEERFRATFEQAAVGIAHVSPDGRFLRVNQRFCRIVGYSRQELQERNVKDISYHEDLETDIQYARDVLQNRRKTYSIEKRFCRKDGSLVWVNLTVSLLRPTSGEAEYFIGVVEDITQRKRNEERLKLALEASNDALWDWIIPENRSYWSPNYYTMLGYAPNEFPPNAENFARLLHPDDRERVVTQVAEAARKGEIYRAEFRLHSKSGKWHWIFSRGKVVEWTQDAQPLRMIGTHVDITARKQAEEKLREYRDHLEELVEQRTRQLRESEEKQRAQYKGVPVPTYTWQKQGEDFILVDYNDAAEKITQGNVEKFLGVTTNELYPEQPEYREDMLRCLTSGLSIEKDMTYHFKTIGEIKHLAVKYAFVPPDFVLVHTEDITMRKQAEKAMKESEARFRTLVDSMDDVIFTLDSEQRHSGVFGHWIENQGLTPELFLGKTSREILGVETALPHEKANEEALNGKNVIYEWSVPNPNGTMSHFQTSLSPMWDDNGQVAGLVGVGRDISKRKQTEEALERAKEEAEKANQAKSEFLANMSHELRTPLNAILGFAQLMQRDPSIPTHQQENLRIISRSGEHLLQLINDVLEMSKIEAGRNTLHPGNFDLYAMLKDLEEMFRFRAREKGINLCFEIEPQLPQFIRSDERKLRQILINLLGNAVRFTEEGQVQLTVTNEQDSVGSKQLPGNSKQGARNSEPQPIAHRLLPTEHCLLFTVKDTGPGIPEEELDMLFEAFSQTTSGRKSGGGSGLGLALSRQFARLLKGDIYVEISNAQGSSFVVNISVEIVESGEIRKLQSSKRVIGLESEQVNYRILCVDDNSESQAILYQLLQPIGFQVREALNGQEAIEQFSQWQPDLIWMDMRMPLMDGYEATRRIRSLEKERQADSDSHTPIIALTANAFEEQRAAVLEAGCDDLISKPFHETEIFAMLQKYLGLRYLYEENAPSPAGLQTDAVPSGIVDAEGFVHLSQELLSELEVAADIVDAEGFAQLPQELLSELEVAAERSNMLEIERLIEQIREHNAALAQTLSLFADDFSYDKILKLLRERE